MPGVKEAVQLDDVSAFLADAVERLATSLGEEHPTVIAGRRIKAALDAVPDAAIMVTEDALAAAIHRAWPYRRNTPSVMALSAASILAALRCGSGLAARAGRRAGDAPRHTSR